jgi:hypothetical protein
MASRVAVHVWRPVYIKRGLPARTSLSALIKSQAQPTMTTFQAYRQSLPSTISDVDAYRGFLIEKEEALSREEARRINEEARRINDEALLARAEKLEEKKQKTVRMQQGLPASTYLATSNKFSSEMQPLLQGH